MKNLPLVSIIIVNWNGGKILEACLASIEKLNYRKKELIIVDNNSHDGTQRYGTIKNKKNLGFAGANNQGLKKAKGKYILLLNNDTLVDKDLINILISKMEINDDLGVIQPKIKIMEKSSILDNAGSFITRIGFLHHWGFMKKDGPEFNNERLVFSVKGACMLIRRGLIDKIGFFDESFFSYFEESDFCWRAWLVGYQCLYYPETAIQHRVGYTIKRLDVENLNWHNYKNRIASLIKNLGSFNLIVILPIHLIISVSISLAFLLKGQVRSFFLIWKAIWWNIVNLNMTLKKRTKIQSQRVVSDKYIFANLSVPVDWKAFFGDFKRIGEDIKRVR